MTLVTSQFDKSDKSVEAVTARNTVLNKEIDAQRDKITTLKAALDNASSSFGENDRRTQNWQVQLNKASRSSCPQNPVRRRRYRRYSKPFEILLYRRANID